MLLCQHCQHAPRLYWCYLQVLEKAEAAGDGTTYLCGTAHLTAADCFLYVLMQGMVRGYPGIVGPLAGTQAATLRSWPHLKAWWAATQHLLGGPRSEQYDDTQWVWAPSYAFNSTAQMLRGPLVNEDKSD